MKGESFKPAPDPNLGNIDNIDVATNQEGSIVPYGTGEHRTAVHWITPDYNVYSVEAEDARPNKK